MEPRRADPHRPTLGYPEKFELALRYGSGPLLENPALTDADRLLMDALAKQSLHGPCNEPRPSMWDSVAKAKWSAWKELGNRSRMEAMFMYVTAVEEFAPLWYEWPPLGLLDHAAPPSAAPYAVAAAGGDG